MDTTSIGIDVSKNWLDVHVHPAGEAFREEQSEAGLKALVGLLQPLGAAVIAVEATGGLEGRFVAAGLPVVVVNPAQVRAYAQALGNRAEQARGSGTRERVLEWLAEGKTDPSDAAVIARLAAAAKPVVRPLPDANTRQLGELLGRRRQIVGMMAADRQREGRTKAFAIGKCVWLGMQIATTSIPSARRCSASITCR